MKAPDKIYLTPLLVEGCSKNLSKRVTENDAVYIRKDLLLEWARKELEMRRNTGDDYFRPAIAVLGDLINKLNSL